MAKAHSAQSVLNILSMPRRVINKRVRRFFSQRAPRKDSLKLGLKNVYIFFSRQGVLFALLLIITFITGINYANNLVLGLCFYLSSIWLISLHITFAHVSGLTIKLLDVSMSEAGAPVWVTIQLHNPSSQPTRQLTLGFDHSDFVEKQTNDANHVNNKVELSSSSVAFTQPLQQTISSLEDTLTIKLPVMTTKRGKLILPRLVVECVYPLGIMRAWSYVYFAKHAWVYPKPLAFEWQTQNHMVGDEDTERSSNFRQGQNDFDKLDEYREGESLARVSWAHVARGQGMLTKHFADPTGHELLLDYADMPAAHHEQKLQQLAFAIEQLRQQGNGGEGFAVYLPNDQGEVGSGQAFIQANLLRLAKAP